MKYAHIYEDNTVGFSNFKDDFYTIEISDEYYNELFDKQEQGYAIKYIGNKIINTMHEEYTPTLDEQLEYYKQKILAKTKELANYEMAGFYESALVNELNELKAKHMEISHELANQINLTY